jgi:polyvinyl alcohol dehydrogenase (cytochrome)
MTSLIKTGQLTRILLLLTTYCVVNSATAAAPPAPGSEDISANPMQLSATGLYQEHCAQCHEGGVPKAPHSVAFQMMGANAILNAMNNGVMQTQAAGLSTDQQLLLAEYLGGSLPSTDTTQPLFKCEAVAAATGLEVPAGQYDWGLTPGNSRSVDAELAGLTAEEIPNLQLQWAFAYPQATRARSQPTVAGGVIYVGSQDGTVYALDLATGCTHWTYQADAEVRSAVTIKSAPAANDNPDSSKSPEAVAFFGDFKGNVYALNAGTGALLWKSNLDDHPNVTITGSPKLHNNRLYVPMSSSEWATAADPTYECCTFRGGVVAFDATDGRMVWKSHSIPESPTAIRSLLSTSIPAQSNGYTRPPLATPGTWPAIYLTTPTARKKTGPISTSAPRQSC